MRRAWIITALALLLLCLPSPNIGAAEAAGAEKPNPMSFSVDLGLWALVVFVLLLFILSRLAWKPMLEGLKKREENIRTAIEEAEKTRQETRKLQAELQARLNKAGEEVREILDEGRRDAQALKDEMLQQAKRDIQADTDRQRREIETAKDQALKQIWEQSAQLATLISAKAIRRELSPDDHRRLVDEALAELQEAGRERVQEMRGFRG
jgi:F-type H+-transporting ATPase subunit b